MKVLRDARQGALLSELQQLGADWAQGVEEKAFDLRRMCELASSSLSAFSRETYEPGHFTASGFVLCPARQRLLLIRHSKLHLWLQPGGHVEATDRDHVEAARREIQEETGLSELTLLERLFDVDVHQIPPLGEHPPHLHYDLRASFVAATDEVNAGDDAEDARWFDLQQVVESEGALADGWTTDESVKLAARRLMK